MCGLPHKTTGWADVFLDHRLHYRHRARPEEVLRGADAPNYKRATTKSNVNLLPPFHRQLVLTKRSSEAREAPIKCSLAGASDNHFSRHLTVQLFLLKVSATGYMLSVDLCQIHVWGSLRNSLEVNHTSPRPSISARPYPTLARKSRPFHNLAHKLTMFFKLQHVRHKCRASECHTPHGQWPTYKRQCAYRPDGRQHSGKGR